MIEKKSREGDVVKVAPQLESDPEAFAICCVKLALHGNIANTLRMQLARVRLKEKKSFSIGQNAHVEQANVKIPSIYPIACRSIWRDSRKMYFAMKIRGVRKSYLGVKAIAYNCRDSSSRLWDAKAIAQS